MKKNILYIGVAIIFGMVAGWLIASGNAENNKDAATHDHNQEIESGQIWTCSMHPQILQSEPGDCPICGMDLIPAESGADGLAMEQFRMTKNALALADIRTTKVSSGTTEDNILKLSGTIVQNEKAAATQAAYFGGRIEKLFINFEGEEVKSGQQLATIYAPELVSAQQELITAAGLKGSQPALYKAVRNKLKLWKLSDKQIDQIEMSGEVRENFPVYANVSGTVTEIMVEAGDYIKKGAPLFKIANLSSVWAIFDVYENQVSLLKENQHVTIVAKSYPDKKFDAKISFITPVLNSATRTVEVRAVLQNSNGQLKPGMFVAGSLMLSANKKDETIIIPESAVLWTGERSVVYVKSDQNNSIFEMRVVTLGEVVGKGYAIRSGLRIGDEIVTNGTFTVDAAAQLQGKKSMMNDAGGKTVTGHEGHTGMEME